MHARLGSGEMARSDCLPCKLEDLAPMFKSREGLGYKPSTGGTDVKILGQNSELVVGPVGTVSSQ